MSVIRRNETPCAVPTGSICDRIVGNNASAPLDTTEKFQKPYAFVTTRYKFENKSNNFDLFVGVSVEISTNQLWVITAIFQNTARPTTVSSRVRRPVPPICPSSLRTDISRQGAQPPSNPCRGTHSSSRQVAGYSATVLIKQRDGSATPRVTV